MNRTGHLSTDGVRSYKRTSDKLNPFLWYTKSFGVQEPSVKRPCIAGLGCLSRSSPSSLKELVEKENKPIFFKFQEDPTSQSTSNSFIFPIITCKEFPLKVCIIEIYGEVTPFMCDQAHLPLKARV